LPYIIRGIIDGDGWIRNDGKEFFYIISIWIICKIFNKRNDRLRFWRLLQIL
jgi:hypothetical protein